MSESNGNTNAVAAPRLPGLTVHERVGGGGTGDVWRATRSGESPREVAIKVMREHGPASRAEWRTLRGNAGPHVVPVLDLLTDADGRACLVMPYYAGGTLDSVVRGRGGLTVGEAVTALAPVASALERLHTRSCTHGDVTPSNVLLDADGRPALADLGASQTIARAEPARWASPGFVAPEVLDGGAPSAASDVYALGCMLWFCCTAEAPGPATLRPRLEDLVPGLPHAFVELVASCLSQTPEARPHAEQVATALMTATEAQPVPVGALPVEENEPAPDTLTRRLRADAQSRQQASRAAGGAHGAGRPRRSGRVRTTREWGARWAGGAALGLVSIGAALAWPVGADSGEGHLADVQGAPPAALQKAAATSSARAASPAPGRVSVPTKAVVQGLLDCRAAAWNTGRSERLSGCLASGSSADRQDRESLNRAAAQQIRYDSIGYDVTRVTAAPSEQVSASPRLSSEVAATAAAQVTLDAFVTTRSYDVLDGTSRRHMSARGELVRLKLAKGPGGWRIVGWNLS